MNDKDKDKDKERMRKNEKEFDFGCKIVYRVGESYLLKWNIVVYP